MTFPNTALRTVTNLVEVDRRNIKNLLEKKRSSMALQWMILAYVVAAEASVAILLTLPAPVVIKSKIISLISLILQPAMCIVPFAGFQLLDLYWKNEHRLACTSEVCTATERDRYEKAIYKAQRNAILCASAVLLYWCIFSITKYYKQLHRLQKVEKQLKEE